jgi:hypothetical protein
METLKMSNPRYWASSTTDGCQIFWDSLGFDFTPLQPILTHSGGRYFALLRSCESTGTTALSQTVTIPSGITATLRFWLAVDGTSSVGLLPGELSVQIRDAAGGSVLETLAIFTNLDATSESWDVVAGTPHVGFTGFVYTKYIFNISAYAGSTITLYFTASEDATAEDAVNASWTGYIIDDVSILPTPPNTVQLSGNSAVGSVGIVYPPVAMTALTLRQPGPLVGLEFLVESVHGWDIDTGPPNYYMLASSLKLVTRNPTTFAIIATYSASFLTDYIDAHPSLFPSPGSNYTYYGYPNWHLSADPIDTAIFIDNTGHTFDGTTGALISTGGLPHAAKDNTFGYSASGSTTYKTGPPSTYNTVTIGGIGSGFGSSGHRGPVFSGTTATGATNTALVRTTDSTSSVWISLYGGTYWGSTTAAMFEINSTNGTLIRTVELACASFELDSAHRVTVAPYVLESSTISVSRAGSYAKYFTFTVGSTTNVEIIVNSYSFDTYAYLLSGTGTGGSILYQDDNSAGTGMDDAKITATLSAGSYTLEATSHDSATTGSFNVLAKIT